MKWKRKPIFGENTTENVEKNENSYINFKITLIA